MHKVITKHNMTFRITSSVLNNICCRRSDFESLAVRLYKQTAPMKYGHQHEPEASSCTLKSL